MQACHSEHWNIPSVDSIPLSDNFTGIEISLPAKYFLYSIILSDFFAVIQISPTAKYFFYSLLWVITSLLMNFL